MKKIIFNFFPFIIFIFIITSCQNGNNLVSSAPVKHQSFAEENPYNYIGIQHNKGLNYVLDKIQNASTIKQKRSKAELLKFTKEKVKEYLVNNNIDTSVVNLVYNNSTFFKNIGRMYKITDSTSVFNGLSDGQKTFVNKILSLTETYNNLENLGDSLNLLDQQALTVLGKKDSKIILMAASIAYNSAEYWENNYNKWLTAAENYLDTTNTLPKVSTIKQVATADVHSFCVAGLIGALGGPESAIGAGASGALVGSALEALSELL